MLSSFQRHKQHNINLSSNRMEQHPLPRKNKKIKGLKGQIYTGTKHLDLHLWSRKAAQKKGWGDVREHEYWCEIIFILMPRFQEQHQSSFAEASAQHGNEGLSLIFQPAYMWGKKRKKSNPNKKTKKKLKEEKYHFSLVQISSARSTSQQIFWCWADCLDQCWAFVSKLNLTILSTRGWN